MTFARLAAQAGATDLFVLHLLTPERLVNLDGYGRGAGWAGNVDVDPAAEPWIQRVLSDSFLRARHGVPRRIFGPYWAVESVGIRAGDHVVVLGGDGVADRAEPLLRAVAESAMELVDEVPVEKRLADDLEVTRAALEVAKLRPSAVAEAARAIASAAAQGTSSEFGAVLLFGPPAQLHVAEDGWHPVGTEEEIMAALLPLATAVTGGLLVEQDTSQSAFPYRPLALEDGLVSRCAVPLGEDGSLGLLLVAHSADAPRGFTMLCQRVMKTIGQTAEEVLGAFTGAMA